MHQLRRTITALLLVFSLILTMTVTAFAKETAVVTGDDVRIHTEPEGSSEVYDLLSLGETVTVVKEADEWGWVKISFVYAPSGKTLTGYVSQDYLSFGDSSKPAQQKPAEEKPAEQKPAEQKPAEEKPAEQKPAEQKPTEEKPAEQKPAEQKPAEEKETAEISSDVSYTATVTNGGVRIRKTPKLSKNNILCTADENDIVFVRSEEDKNGWMKVTYYDAEGTKFKGYMSGEYLDINTIGVGSVTVPGAVIRENADRTSPITGVVPKNGEVDIYASKNNWYKIEYMDKSGWIHSNCVKTESETTCAGYAKTKTDALNLREKPSTDSNVLNQLPKGVVLQVAKVKKTKKEGTWYAVRYNGTNGYISADYAKFTDSCSSGYIQVTASSLSLRSGAGASYTRMTTIPNGKVLKVQGSVGAWYLVTYGKFTGYVSGDYVSATTKEGFNFYGDYAEVTSKTLNMREKPSKDSDVLNVFRKGDILVVTGMVDGWYEIDYEGMIGYVKTDMAARGTEKTDAVIAMAEAIANGTYQEEEEEEEHHSSSSSSGSSSGSSGSGNGSILSYASQFAGNPYKWGGSSLTNGTDCSGFVKSVLAHFGYSVPHSSSAIRGYGKSVSVSDMKPGDVVCYSGHVGIYAGDGQLLSALGKKYGITYNDVHYKTILSVRRFN